MSTVASWFVLLGAIVSEVLGTTCMKLSAGFTKTLPSVGMFCCYGVSLVCLTFALRRIEVSVAYAIWSGVGTTLISVVGVFAFRENVSVLKIASLVLVIVGIVGLRLSFRAT
jgi:small multidrug resistance pump